MLDGVESLADLKAKDIMSQELTLLREDDTVREAASTLLDNEIHGAPVHSETGEVTGVLSMTDLARYEREREPHLVRESDYYHVRDVGKNFEVPWDKGFHAEEMDEPRVRDVMTPSVISVRLESSLRDIVDTLLRFKIHRVLVMDHENRAAGLVTEMDILGALKRLLHES